MNNPLSNISLGFIDSLGISTLGFSIVFGVLVVLMVVIRILRTGVERMEAAKAVAAPAPAAASAPAAANPDMIPAKGSLGEVKLHDVDDRTAAMIMAIVADTLGAPLNELRFHSIREKK